MKIVITADKVKLPTGKEITKGTELDVTNEYGKKLIDSKAAKAWKPGFKLSDLINSKTK